MTKVRCDCKICFSRVDLDKKIGLPITHIDPRSGRYCPGSEIPPAWRSDGVGSTPKTSKQSSLTVSEDS